MSTSRKKLKGRPATDAKGNTIWKWGEGEGEVATGLIQALGEGLSLETTSQKPVVDPYNQSAPRSKEQTKGARSLDDMRRMSEEMKREHKKLVGSLRKREVRKSDTQPARGMHLRFDNREVVVGKNRTRITIGRAEDNDVMITGERISRVHARIESSRNKFILTDQSTNGTYVRTTDGQEFFVRRGGLELKGKGMIGVGRKPRQDAAHTIHFTCDEI
jgi:hypothetical protein